MLAMTENSVYSKQHIFAERLEMLNPHANCVDVDVINIIARVIKQKKYILNHHTIQKLLTAHHLKFYYENTHEILFKVYNLLHSENPKIQKPDLISLTDEQKNILIKQFDLLLNTLKGTNISISYFYIIGELLEHNNICNYSQFKQYGIYTCHLREKYKGTPLHKAILTLTQ